MKFEEFKLQEPLRKSIEKLGYNECTPIQEQAIPKILGGFDIAGLAQTGTGKTAAFLVPLMERILLSQKQTSTADAEADTTATVPSQEGKDKSEDASEGEAHVADDGFVEKERFPYFKNWRSTHFILILVPTRELAEQVLQNVKSLGESLGMTGVAIYGGMSYNPQKQALNRGVQFIVATPGRLIDLYKDHVVDLRLARAVVFDEADRMFDMGFKDDMRFLLRRIPKDRQFLVFSATLNFDVLNVAYEFGADPIEINISKDQAKAENVKDTLYHVGQEEKPAYLLSLLRKHNPKQTIIFSNFKRNVERIALFLSRNGQPAVGISSLLSQGQRNRVLAQFKAENDKNILVATDVAARGLDIKGVDLVINFELPDDPENYVHRIGRTGRAGAEGVANSLVCDRDLDSLGRIETYLGHKVGVSWLESEEIGKDFKPYPSEREAEASSYKAAREDQREHRTSSGPSSGGDRPRGENSSFNEGQHRDKRMGRHRNDSAGGRPGGDRPQQPHGPRRNQDRFSKERPDRGGNGNAERDQRPSGDRFQKTRREGPSHRDARDAKVEQSHSARGPQSGRPAQDRTGKSQTHARGNDARGNGPKREYKHASRPKGRPDGQSAAKSKSTHMPKVQPGVAAKVGSFLKRLFTK